MSEQALHSKRPWRAVLARRRWRSGYNAGGSPAYIGNSEVNFKYRINRIIDYELSNLLSSR